ncbi:MAG: NAD(P)-binding protein [Chitinophagia bacterium]|jgi:protoporphyrinogen oxidase
MKLSNIVIVGSGISGLLYALIASEKYPDKTIHIIEKENEAGGLLRAFDYGINGKFDYGMHNFLETSITELDKYIFDLLPEDDWQILAGEKRDLAGIFINGKLQHHTPFIDLRNLNSEDYEKAVADFLLHLNFSAKENNQAISKDLNAKDYIRKRFGEEVANRAILPALEKIHKKKAEELDYMATVFTPMTRVALFDEPLVGQVTQSPFLRQYIAYADQRNLPLERSTGRRGYYPKKYGMYRVVNAFIEKLKQRNVQILTDSYLENIEIEDNTIVSAQVFSKGAKILINDIHKFVWTSNIPLLGRFLNVDFSGLKNDKPLKTIIISFLLNKPLDMGGLYYFFCYDKNYHTYRLNDFSAYCNGAFRNGGYPVSIEFLVDEQYLLSSPDIALDAAKELFSFGITQPATEVLFSKAEILESGFPMPTSNNINAIKKIRKQIKNMNLKNVEILGILSEDNLFFQTDVLIDTYNKINTNG